MLQVCLAHGHRCGDVPLLLAILSAPWSLVLLTSHMETLLSLAPVTSLTLSASFEIPVAKILPWCADHAATSAKWLLNC